MLRALSEAALRRVLVPVFFLLLLPACDDKVKQLRTAADLRGQIENALRQMEATKQVPGLRHRHVTVEPDADAGGFSVKIYDMKLGDAKIGFQAFDQLSFSLAQSDALHFAADHFALKPAPIGEGPSAAAATLVEQLKHSVATLHPVDD